MQMAGDSISLPSSGSLLKARFWFYSVALAHLVVTATVSLSIDMSGDQDPHVSAYINIRWKLLTCWFNMVTLAYFPICMYCDWKERCGQWKLPHVVRLRQIKDFMMTGILFPITLGQGIKVIGKNWIIDDSSNSTLDAVKWKKLVKVCPSPEFADFIFWRIWHKDLSLIAPPGIFAYLPYWTQHSLHTVSMLIMVLDLLLVPRRRPRSLWPGLRLMLSFLATYMLVCGISFLRGEVVYTVFKIFDGFKIVLLAIMVIVECLFFYLIQWCIVDLFWGQVHIGVRIKKIL